MIPIASTRWIACASRSRSNVLRVAAADVSRRIPLMVVSDHLTAIAEAILRAALAIAWRDITARHGRPETMAEGASFAPYAVIAYGKLGGIELGYGSDLDLVFVHDDDPNARTTGAKPIDLATFYARLTQRLIHVLTIMTAQGELYEVDPRLRPDGSNGVLVNTLDGLAQYLRDKAWTWEHQALVRARAVAGDPALGERFARMRSETLLRDREGDTLRDEVRTMRERMRAELGSHRAGRFDLKQGSGGVADIEFIVQYGTLRWASRLGAHLRFTDNIRLLEGVRAGRPDAGGGRHPAVGRLSDVQGADPRAVAARSPRRSSGTRNSPGSEKRLPASGIGSWRRESGSAIACRGERRPCRPSIRRRTRGTAGRSSGSRSGPAARAPRERQRRCRARPIIARGPSSRAL